jgi:hypothetical protein
MCSSGMPGRNRAPKRRRRHQSLPAPRPDLDPAAGRPYLQAFSIRFSKTWNSSSRVPATMAGPSPRAFRCHAGFGRQRLKRIDDTADQPRTRSTRSDASKNGFISSRDSDSRSSISRAMRPVWSCMILRNWSRAFASSRAGPRKRLDEAGDRRQRRAQFVAGIGDEVGAHAVDAAYLALVAEDDDKASPLEPVGERSRETSVQTARARDNQSGKSGSRASGSTVSGGNARGPAKAAASTSTTETTTAMGVAPATARKTIAANAARSSQRDTANLPHTVTNSGTFSCASSFTMFSTRRFTRQSTPHSMRSNNRKARLTWPTPRTRMSSDRSNW